MNPHRPFFFIPSALLFLTCVKQLEFPGAIFAGIYDDESPDGLAAMVRKELPEDSVIVDLDSGEIDCSDDRYAVLKQSWGAIPSSLRSTLVSELETLCRDAGIAPGQEPLDSEVDASFFASVPGLLVDDSGHHDGFSVPAPLDDRAIRDAFLRFFCAVLGGYDRYLVAPDMDFMTSGNEWFDSQGFLSSRPSELSAYLQLLLPTQLFQSFVQRRTESSDIRCLLFDECLAEYHSSPDPYGRLGGDIEATGQTQQGQPEMLYSLLVDQCCSADSSQSGDVGSNSDVPDSGQTDSVTTDSTTVSLSMEATILSLPSAVSLPPGLLYTYCRDGHPHFPQTLNHSLFLPIEPTSLDLGVVEYRSSLLARSQREMDDAYRRQKTATSTSGLSGQRRCLWQLPKLMVCAYLS